MARRRKRDDEHDNHERWLVSYADFITLLFAFFVVMYALSTVNEGKYRILSDSMTAAFRSIQANSSTQLPVVVTPPLPMAQKQNQAAKQAEADSSPLASRNASRPSHTRHAWVASWPISAFWVRERSEGMECGNQGIRNGGRRADDRR